MNPLNPRPWWETRIGDYVLFSDGSVLNIAYQAELDALPQMAEKYIEFAPFPLTFDTYIDCVNYLRRN